MSATSLNEWRVPSPCTRCDRATLRRLRTERIAMVFQQFALLPWRTVAENVGFGLELADGSTAHTACLGFGLERIVIALFRTHGLLVEEAGK